MLFRGVIVVWIGFADSNIWLIAIGITMMLETEKD